MLNTHNPFELSIGFLRDYQKKLFEGKAYYLKLINNPDMGDKAYIDAYKDLMLRHSFWLEDILKNFKLEYHYDEHSTLNGQGFNYMADTPTTHN